MPLIVVTPQLGVNLIPSLPARIRTFRYALVTGGWKGTEYFAADGLVHKLVALIPEKPLSLVQRALATTIYNPRLTVAVRFEPPRTFEHEELRTLLVSAVEDDDDILTQWREKRELLDMLARAQNYTHLVGTLRFAGLRPAPE